MNRTIVCFLLLVMSLLIVGCGSDSTQSVVDTPIDSEPVAVIDNDLNDVVDSIIVDESDDVEIGDLI